MSGADLQASIEIKTTPDIVLSAFQAIERWSMWYPGVINASWIAGEPWQLQAVMEIQVHNSLGMLIKSTAVVLPAGEHPHAQTADRDLAISGQRILCWENRAPGLVTVCYAWAEASDIGCRFTLQKYYRGELVLLLRLMKRRQQRMLCDALTNLNLTCT